jgi:hypothetical protein
LSEVISAAHLRDLGSLLLAFVMLWAYMAFSQYLIIWSGNLPEEIPWYLRRLQGGYQWIGLLLLLFHFGLPFLLLLSTNFKRNARALGILAGLILLMRFVDLFWLVMPAFTPANFSVHWMDVAAVLGVGGIWLAFFMRELNRLPLLPIHDPLIVEAVAHG